jgi:hypothetical protein
MLNYWWVRIFDYNYERDLEDKGTLLDEYYVEDVDSRDKVKEIAKKKYCGESSDKLLYAKPKKKDGIYAIVMESSKFFYDRFYLKIKTRCFYCLNEIEGRECDFPSQTIQNKDNDLDVKKSEFLINEDDISNEETVYFCSHDCKHNLNADIRYEGEFQTKEVEVSGSVFGYIYLMYNRIENKYYIGQTRYYPFFRWQEHIKSGGKGNITDITFNVISEVKRNKKIDESGNQEYLNNVEAWWISKYIEEGYEIQNVTIPKLTISDFKRKYNEMIAKEGQLSIL